MQKPFARPPATALSPATPLTDDPPPDELVRRCLHGDAAAWRLLVERYVRLVRSIPARQGFSPGEVDDVGQEVFLALAQNLHLIEDAERLPAWLVTTTRRVCWRQQARRRNEEPLERAESGVGDDGPPQRELVSPLPTPQEVLQDWERQQTLHQALARLGDRCRQLLTLIFLDPDEPSYDEISARLEMPKGSIGPTRNRCLQQLRSHLDGVDIDR
jgi:RNA polymerase sigma factor (sigma-70 family)